MGRSPRVVAKGAKEGGKNKFVSARSGERSALFYIRKGDMVRKTCRDVPKYPGLTETQQYQPFSSIYTIPFCILIMML